MSVAQITAREAAMLARLGYGIALTGPVGPITESVNAAGEPVWTIRIGAEIITDPITGLAMRMLPPFHCAMEFQ